MVSFVDDKQQFDLGVACDVLLDLLRYHPEQILDAKMVVQGFNITKERNLTYDLADFLNHIRSKFTRVIVEGLINLVVQIRDNQLVKNLWAVSFNIAGAVGGQVMKQAKNDLAKVVQAVIEHRSGSNSNVLGASTRSRAGSDKSRKSARSPRVKIQDSERVAYAENLIKTIEKNVQAERPYDEVGDLLQYLGSTEAVKHLNGRGINISTEMACVVLLLTLKSRTEQNVSAEALTQYEESQDLDTCAALIQGKTPKTLFDMLVKHHALMVKESYLGQADAETLLNEALVNFKCTKNEAFHIGQFVQG